MDEIIIKLSDEYGLSLETKELAIKIFKNIPKNVDKVIFNFQGIHHVGCLFLREFLKLSEDACFEVEKEYFSSYEDVLKLISKCNKNFDDMEFINFLKENI